MAMLCTATLSSSVLPKSPPAHLGSLQRRSQFITGPIGGVPNLNNTRKGSSSPPSFTIRCLKGVAAPTPDILSRIFNGGVTPTPVPDPTAVTRQDFPPDFIFGCATSALQTESSATEGGRGPSTWDSMLEGEDAVDSYFLYPVTFVRLMNWVEFDVFYCDELSDEEDVKQLVQMGADVYRLSISWTRILPDGTIAGGINQVGIDFYNGFIDELVKNGITPVVTLFHFDLPTALQTKYRGFLSTQIINDFKDYANLCFQTFGDRVKYWATVNEPQVFSQYGYATGLNPPDSKPATNPFVVAHNIILAHATVAKLYKDTYQPTQKGEIGIPLVTQWFEAYQPGRPDDDAARRAFDFLTGWFLEPLIYGDYPFIMKALVGDNLPTFTDDQKVLVQGSYDFIGVNYYTSSYANALPLLAPGATVTSQADFQRVDLTQLSDLTFLSTMLVPATNSQGVLIGPQAPGSTSIYIYPQGLRDVLIYIASTYGNPKIIITENGYPEKRDDSIPVEIAIQDNGRIQHMIGHLYAISEALKAGSNVKGYLMWALMDCMEVGSGYTVRYGLAYTDYLNNYKRIAKKSSGWLYSFLNAPALKSTPAPKKRKTIGV
ncbi:unnamed protein product [Ilex paraguariensis]|uniref:Beta-glucosidase n=1 Tax=Ilex paraguariensis TaxID=185542 RepID=A0ABC8V0V3_9AQUA